MRRTFTRPSCRGDRVVRGPAVILKVRGAKRRASKDGWPPHHDGRPSKHGRPSGSYHNLAPSPFEAEPPCRCEPVAWLCAAGERPRGAGVGVEGGGAGRGGGGRRKREGRWGGRARGPA